MSARLKQSLQWLAERGPLGKATARLLLAVGTVLYIGLYVVLLPPLPLLYLGYALWLAGKSAWRILDEKVRA